MRDELADIRARRAGLDKWEHDALIRRHERLRKERARQVRRRAIVWALVGATVALLAWSVIGTVEHYDRAACRRDPTCHVYEGGK